ncbi:hypothetical protein NA56DRAFT_703875 [Hyaloscypha hepaticicola]|uniref:DUF6590 domain-containing protein n=1 Tax=Hyaloscypha hepaticicola TaxID=2082293 RepID=A0A2J6Q4H1_9HELO|nr:hypothetical protein NA56DRAFT_703875 [Hyaloscypha hepaticicola]
MSSRASRRKKSSKGTYATDWSDWAWDEGRKSWASYRLGTNGEYEYRFEEDSAQQSTTTSTYQDSGSPEIPRYAPSPGPDYIDSSQGPYSSSPVNPGYTTRNFEDTTAALGSLTLEKGKERENDYVAPQVSSSYSVAASVTPIIHTASPVIDHTYAAQYSQTTEASLYQQPEYYEDQYPLDSASPASQQPFDSGLSRQGNTTGQSSLALRGDNFIGEGVPAANIEKPLDARFKVHSGREFKFGKVFRMLWAEPMGSHGTQITEPVHSRSQKHGEVFWHKIRRFVIVKPFNGHCLCLPIQTYGRQGLTKGGATAEHHAAIYSEEEVVFEGEGLTKKGIRVVLFNPRDKLDATSRINYAKVYTIEYNVKVHFIGRLDPNHKHRILGDLKNTTGMDFQESS